MHYKKSFCILLYTLRRWNVAVLLVMFYILYIIILYIIVDKFVNQCYNLIKENNKIIKKKEGKKMNTNVATDLLYKNNYLTEKGFKVLHHFEKEGYEKYFKPFHNDKFSRNLINFVNTKNDIVEYFELNNNEELEKFFIDNLVIPFENGTYLNNFYAFQDFILNLYDKIGFNLFHWFNDDKSESYFEDIDFYFNYISYAYDLLIDEYQAFYVFSEQKIYIYRLY